MSDYDYVFYTNVEFKPAVEDFLRQLNAFWPDLIIKASVNGVVYEYNESFFALMGLPLWMLDLYRDEEMKEDAALSGGALMERGDCLIQLYCGIESAHDSAPGNIVYVLDKARTFTVVLTSDPTSDFTKTILAFLTASLMEQVSAEYLPENRAFSDVLLTPSGIGSPVDW